jgi:hypothetical protein
MKQLWERFGDFMGAPYPVRSNGFMLLESAGLVQFGFFVAYFAR